MKEHERFGRRKKLYSRTFPVVKFEVATYLAVGAIELNVSSGDGVKFRRKFDADDARKGKLRRHKQNSAFFQTRGLRR